LYRFTLSHGSFGQLGKASLLMIFKTFFLWSVASFTLAMASPPEIVLGASLDEVVKSLKGLSAKDRLARLETEARKEGSVRWASSTPQAWAEPALQVFRKRYTGIQVEYMRQSGRVLAERIVREYRAGKNDIDIIGTSAVTFAGMKDAGVITPYISPEAAELRKDMKDPEGWWTAYFGNIQAIICNRNRAKTAPGDWKDFLDPKWKGEFSIDDTRYEWFYALQKIYGAQEANKLITGFRQNGVNLRRGGTLRAQLVGAGEESCGLGVYLNNVRDLLEQNAPVNYSVPEPVLVVPVINMMAKLPPHPYAAILLYDFILTPEATGQYTRANAMAPARDNLPLVKEVTELQGKRFHVVDVEASSRDYEKTVKEYSSLLKAGR
jgi:iron(III) transport system substrate-binding protein